MRLYIVFNTDMYSGNIMKQVFKTNHEICQSTSLAKQQPSSPRDPGSHTDMYCNKTVTIN